MPKILIVDDELSFREVLRYSFEKNGHQVDAAINADHASALMKDKRYDMIILDVAMPGESGMDLLKKIRSNNDLVPIVIYSVKVDAMLETQARQAGANEVLHKNIPLPVLVDRAEKIMGFSGTSASAAPSNTKQLLVVDDEQPVRKILSLFFGKKGYQVSEAANGEQAVEMLRSWKPDIILLDMNMGGMNGLETLAEIRKIHPTVGVVMATGNENDQKVHDAMVLGAYGYVLKPFDFTYLELVVASKVRVAEA